MKKVKDYHNSFIYERTAEGEEMYDVFSRLMKERVIFVTDEIEQTSTDAIVAQMMWLSHQNDKKEISLYINSPGGSVSCMFAMYDTMQSISAPIHTVVIGQAASAAAILLASGRKGYRLAAPHSQIMIHQPWTGGIDGQITDISIEVKMLENYKRKLIETLAIHTGQPYEKVMQDCERNYYLDANEAVKYGIVDSLISYNKEIPPLIENDSKIKSEIKRIKKSKNKQ